MHLAAYQGSMELLPLFIENGGNVSARAADGKTPLHLAVMSGNQETVELLVKSGSDVNAQDNFGNTPLGIALGYLAYETESGTEQMFVYNVDKSE